MKLQIVPITFKEANSFVTVNHRHHGKVVGCKFCVAVSDGRSIRGVAIIGRPVARSLDDGWTLEINRCCTDGVKMGCSMLYAAAWRVARALGYRKLVTYILESEPGTSLGAAGWQCVGKVKGRSWHCPSRPRYDKHPTVNKLRFEICADE